MSGSGGATDVVILGGDIPALLLAYRLAKLGQSVQLVADKVGNGSVGLGPGVLSVHFGDGFHALEQSRGFDTARAFLGYRQFVLDELLQDFSTLSLPDGVAKQGWGHRVAHDPLSMLALRNDHEAVNRHGGARRLEEDPDDRHLHDAVRLVSSHRDDVLFEPAQLARALAEAFADAGGQIVSFAEELNSEGTLCQLEPVPAPVVTETLVLTEPDVHGESGEIAWYQNSFPMFETAKRLPDGRWVVSSRRSWDVHEGASQSPRLDDAALLLHRLEPERVWQRRIAVYGEPTLPLVEQEGTQIRVVGMGQEDPVMDLIGVDRALRALLKKPDAFASALEQLPLAEEHGGFLSTLALQALLDDWHARDAKRRS